MSKSLEDKPQIDSATTAEPTAEGVNESAELAEIACQWHCPPPPPPPAEEAGDRRVRFDLD